MAFLDSDPADLDPQAGWLDADDWAQSSRSQAGFSGMNDGAEQSQNQHEGWQQGTQDIADEQARLEQEAIESCHEFADATTFDMDWYNLEGVSAENGSSSDALTVPQIPALPHAFMNYDWSGLESFGEGIGQGNEEDWAAANQQVPEQYQVHENPGDGGRGTRPPFSLQRDVTRTSEPSTIPEANHSMPLTLESTPEASSSRPKQRKRGAAGRGKVPAARNVNKSRKLKCDICKEGAKRAAEHIPGEYDDLTLCDRHQKAWSSNHGEIIWWDFQHWDPEDAINRIRPDFEPPEAYLDPEYFDRTFWENHDKADEWTRRFLDAIQTPYVYEGEGEPDKHSMERKLLDHQTALRFRARSRRGKENGFQYHEDMVNARVTLLFHIALRFHSGGTAIYCTGGDNWGFREGTTLTFLERLEVIEDILRENKRVAMDVIEGRGVEALVKNPVKVQERKNTNNKNNPRRRDKGGGDGADGAGGASGINTRSGTPSQVDSGSSPLPESRTGTKMSVAGRSKRKRPAKDEASAEEQEQPSAPKTKRMSFRNDHAPNGPATPSLPGAEHATSQAGPSSNRTSQNSPQYQQSASTGTENFSHPHSSSGQGLSSFDSNSLPSFSSFNLRMHDSMTHFQVPGMPSIFSDFGDHAMSSAAQQTTEGGASAPSGPSFGPTIQDAEMHSYQSGGGASGDSAASSGLSFGPTVQGAEMHFHSPSPGLQVHSPARDFRMSRSPMLVASSPFRSSSSTAGSLQQARHSSRPQEQYPQRLGNHGSSSHLSPSWGQRAIPESSGQASRMSASPAPSSVSYRTPMKRPEASLPPSLGSSQSAGPGNRSTSFNLSASPMGHSQRSPQPAQSHTVASQHLPTTPQYIDPTLLTQRSPAQSTSEQLQDPQPQPWHQPPASNTQWNYQQIPSLKAGVEKHLARRMLSRDTPTPGTQRIAGSLERGLEGSHQTVLPLAPRRPADQTALGTALPSSSPPGSKTRGRGQGRFHFGGKTYASEEEFDALQASRREAGR